MTLALTPITHSNSNQCFNPSKDEDEADKTRRRASDLFWNDKDYLESAKERFKILNRKSFCMMDLLLLQEAICCYAMNAKAARHFD